MTKSVHFQIVLGPKGFESATGHKFRGLTVTPGPEGFNCVLRGVNSKGAPVYAMMQGNDPGETLMTLFQALCSEFAPMLWRLDAWAQENSK